MNTLSPVRTGANLTDEEFLAFIETRPDEERWQLIDGVATMMPPPMVPHQIIAANLAFELNALFRQQRRNLIAVQEVGLSVPNVANFRPRADMAVLDKPFNLKTPYADRFYLVLEVRSDSNTDQDIAAKRRGYIQHPQNLYYLFVEQDEVRIEIRARAAGWEPVEPNGLDAILELPQWGFSMPLAALYDGTPLGVAQ
jgi:Uma2 family endonuclease